MPRPDQRSPFEQSALDRIAEARAWLHAHREDIERARREWDDLAWCHDALLACQAVLRVLEEYQPANQPHEAVYRIAQGSSGLASVFAGLELIQEAERQLELVRILGRQIDQAERTA